MTVMVRDALVKAPGFWHRLSRRMNHRIPLRRRPLAIVRLLLAMLVLRAYVPVGFMPDSDNPLLLHLCHAATQFDTPLDHRQSGSHGGGDGCLFGNAPAVGPLGHLLALAAPPQIDSSISSLPDRVSAASRPQRAHQPRAPPSLA